MWFKMVCELLNGGESNKNIYNIWLVKMKLWWYQSTRTGEHLLYYCGPSSFLCDKYNKSASIMNCSCLDVHILRKFCLLLCSWKIIHMELQIFLNMLRSRRITHEENVYGSTYFVRGGGTTIFGRGMLHSGAIYYLTSKPYPFCSKLYSTSNFFYDRTARSHTFRIQNDWACAKQKVECYFRLCAMSKAT
jgi:hypothetical protein